MRVGLLVYTLRSVQVNVRGIPLRVLPVQQGEDIRLVQAMIDVIELLSVVCTNFARDITIIRQSGITFNDGVVGVVSHVGSVDVLRAEAKGSLRQFRGQSKSTVGSVDIIVVSQESIRRDEGVQQSEGSSISQVILDETSGIVPKSSVVATIGKGSNGSNQLDKMRIQLVSMIPVVDIDIVG